MPIEVNSYNPDSAVHDKKVPPQKGAVKERLGMTDSLLQEQCKRCSEPGLGEPQTYNEIPLKAESTPD